MMKKNVYSPNPLVILQQHDFLFCEGKPNSAKHSKVCSRSLHLFFSLHLLIRMENVQDRVLLANSLYVLWKINPEAKPLVM